MPSKTEITPEILADEIDPKSATHEIVEEEDGESPLFKVSSVLAPPKVFTVDGDVFTLYDVRHFDPDMEARYRLLMKQERLINKRIDDALAEDDEDAALKQSLLARENRVRIIKLCTTMPEKIARKLDFFGQGKIVQAVILAAANLSADKMKKVFDANDTPEVV